MRDQTPRSEPPSHATPLRSVPMVTPQVGKSKFHPHPRGGVHPPASLGLAPSWSADVRCLNIARLYLQIRISGFYFRMRTAASDPCSCRGTLSWGWACCSARGSENLTDCVMPGVTSKCFLCTLWSALCWHPFPHGGSAPSSFRIPPV